MSLNVVVGAARGIGRAIAEELARADPSASLLVADVDADGAEKLLPRAEGDGGRWTATRVDVADPASVEALVAQSS